MSTPETRFPRHKFRLFFSCLIALGCLLAAFPPTPAAGDQPVIIYVNEKILVSGNGESWETAFKDFQGALDAASGKKAEIWVAAGTYKPTDGDDPAESFVLKDDVALYGGFAGDEDQRDDRDFTKNVTTLEGSGNTVVCAIGVNETAVLDGFTITGGNANGGGTKNNGGGMYIENGNPTVANCTFSGNTATSFGGGMHIKDGSPTLTNSTFSGNNAYRGGGMYIEGASPELTNCTLSGNTATSGGGGMYIKDGSPTLTNCTFSVNTATSDGGGMHIEGASPTLTNCTFQENKTTGSSSGGGMFINKGSPTVTDCTFSKNSAKAGGGGMHVYSSTSKVTDCTFSENSAKAGGGGIYATNSSLTVMSCTFSGNTATDGNTATNNGGGMYISNGSPTVTDCIFSDNTATDDGGGMYIFYGKPTVTNCTFLKNEADNNGGGMFITSNSSTTMTNCTFSKNTATVLGGGIYVKNSSLTVTGCTFSENSAGSAIGGGMYMVDGDPTVTNCTFSKNTATSGGGVYIINGSPNFTNCTFSENTATVLGGGLCVESGSPKVTNTIFWGAGSAAGQVVDQSKNLTITYSVTDFLGQGNINADPRLGPLKNNGGQTQTCALGEDSPAIDSGTASGSPETDQRGVTRPQGDGVDMGSYEFEGGTLIVTIEPEKAWTAGAMWSHDGGKTWRASGEAVHPTPGNYTVTFKPIDGWTTPGHMQVDIIRVETVEKSGTYTRHTGSLTVTTSPAEAGGKWKIEGETNWRSSGEEVADLPTGSYTVTFSDVSGWITPRDETVTVILNRQIEISIAYEAEPKPKPEPKPFPTPPQPVAPPKLPTGTTLPEGSSPSTAEPLDVETGPDPSPEEKREAIEEALEAAGLTEALAESLAGLLDVDGAGQIYPSDEGMESLEGELGGLDIPEDAVRAPLPLFTVPNIPAGNTVIVYFQIPAGLIDKPSSRLQAVKILSPGRAELFKRVYSFEELADGCSAVVEVDGQKIIGVLGSDDFIDGNSRLALAIQDGGSFDLDGQVNGAVTDPAFILEAVESLDPDVPGGGGGCSAGPSSPWTIALLAPLALLARRRRLTRLRKSRPRG
ncbi:MAG: right-handed parallel beta-helix repeat-containing protein [Aminivibrio sp.]|jgi:parallel beta-helix repeat protein/predicted outer membrane repeat protein